MSVRVFQWLLFTLLALGLPFLCAEPLDFLLGSERIEVQRCELRGHEFKQGRFPNELTSYDAATTFLGFQVKEAVLRYLPNTPLVYAHILIDMEMEIAKVGRMREVSQKLYREIADRLGAAKGSSYFTFPNRRMVNVVYWEGKFHRVYLITRLIHDGKSNDAAFVAVRWETADAKPCDFPSWFGTANKRYVLPERIPNGKMVYVPMRSQYPGSGGCWFTTISRQLLYLGTDWEPIYVMIAFGAGEAQAAKDLGPICRFKYINIDGQPRENAAKLCMDAIACYNVNAQMKGIKTIPLSPNEKGEYYFGDELSNVDFEVWKRSCRVPADFVRFRNFVIQSIDAGLPLGWTVVRHTGPSKHRRMIIGYDIKRESFFYTDSWGISYDVREIPMTAAYCATVWMQKIIPVI